MIDSEEDYNSIIPESYLSQYPWDVKYEDEFPWLWMNFMESVAEGTKICIKHDNKLCDFIRVPENVGTVSEDKKVLTLKKLNEYVSFDCQNDLGIQKADVAGIYQVYVLGENGAVVQEIVFECK